MVESTYGHDIIVTGANYPPSQSQVIIAQGTQALWFVGLGLVFAGDVILKALGFKEPPQFFQQAKENKMMVLGGLWRRCSSIGFGRFAPHPVSHLPLHSQ